MSFSSQKTLCYLIDQFNNWLLIVYIKILIVLKCQQFDNNKSEKTVLIANNLMSITIKRGKA